ncbi:hypothetical protein CF326_g4050 [Tilletia indica]|nr:hypothetical protein CF326_g4050 [Tilletia indica]
MLAAQRKWAPFVESHAPVEEEGDEFDDYHDEDEEQDINFGKDEEDDSDAADEDEEDDDSNIDPRLLNRYSDEPSPKRIKHSTSLIPSSFRSERQDDSSPLTALIPKSNQHADTVLTSSTLTQVLGNMMQTVMQDMRSEIREIIQTELQSSTFGGSREGSGAGSFTTGSGSSNVSVSSASDQEWTQVFNKYRFAQVKASSAEEYSTKTGNKVNKACIWTLKEARQAIADSEGVPVAKILTNKTIPLVLVIRDAQGSEVGQARVDAIQAMVRELIKAHLEGLPDSRTKDEFGFPMGTRGQRYYEEHYSDEWDRVTLLAEAAAEELRFCEKHWKSYAMMNRRLKSLSEKDLLKYKKLKTVAQAKRDKRQGKMEALQNKENTIIPAAIHDKAPAKRRQTKSKQKTNEAEISDDEGGSEPPPAAPKPTKTRPKARQVKRKVQDLQADLLASATEQQALKQQVRRMPATPISSQAQVTPTASPAFGIGQLNMTPQSAASNTPTTHTHTPRRQLPAMLPGPSSIMSTIPFSIKTIPTRGTGPLKVKAMLR